MTSTAKAAALPISRRESYVTATRQALLDAGLRVFTTRPYADVTGQQLGAEAGVTRGALQHHFGSKQGLFQAVFTQLQDDAVQHVVAAITVDTDPWEQAIAGLTAFLDTCTATPYRTVVLCEGPAALGWQRWHELDRHYFDSLVTTMLDTLAGHGLADHPPVLLAATLRGALTELSFEIAAAENPAVARTEALAVVDRLINAFRCPSPHRTNSEA